ncbi:hypothetical protein ABOM_009809 [Aspergillus bombycis]|uniref:proline--tRNA ligase n=1 Tax=Aspergillus bombycis TaxID=109264 RepID=A0A1F7ZS63_9EURO|nr:hypothetical protein ABOM_009809 [Aspergillus bombycis]OGM41925.1 hypothetical protein ABOM_009809 [Aspergillus bombycis]
MATSAQVIGDLTSKWHIFNPAKTPSPPNQGNQSEPKKKTRGAALIGIDVSKDVDFSNWYQQVLLKGKMIDYYDISGCYILRPGSWAIWEMTQEWFNKQIKRMGVRNCSFPLFVAEEMLNREQNHIEGFSAEVAWVTQSCVGLLHDPDAAYLHYEWNRGNTKLDKRIAIRPTSETVIYPYLAKWIRSYRELPLRLNQWNSVVRWEFSNPQPFLRSREFYWQEGHSAHLTSDTADKEVLDVLGLYEAIYRDLLAIPVIPGRKTEKEKFAGANYTTTVEAYIPTTGRAIQGATSHSLGQNFSKMFNISIEAPSSDGTENKTQKTFVWQNSWAYSTRVLGVMVMVHGDNKGLVMPPRVAPVQVIIIPVGITAHTEDDLKEKIVDSIVSTKKALEDAEVRVEMDTRDEYSPGWKFNDWELKGVPLRLEIGPKEVKGSFISMSRRDTGGKGRIASSRLVEDVLACLETIQSEMYLRVLDNFRRNVKIITEWSLFTLALNNKHICLIPFCLKEDCEERIKKSSECTADSPMQEHDARAPSMGAKSLCIPFHQPTKLDGSQTKCLGQGCKRTAEQWCLFGRSY